MESLVASDERRDLSEDEGSDDLEVFDSEGLEGSGVGGTISFIVDSVESLELSDKRPDLSEDEGSDDLEVFESVGLEDSGPGGSISFMMDVCL